ncbi:MAG: hypothetical protein JW809_04040, partial [Pirellulales bacterium]|nr:hypothetical protein [Pirellulales bacterium]
SLLNHRARLLSDLYCQVVKNGVWLFSKSFPQVQINLAQSPYITRLKSLTALPNGVSWEMGFAIPRDETSRGV